MSRITDFRLPPPSGGQSMLIPLKLVRDQQLQQQIFDQLRDLIVTNRLRPGSRMPSSRMMAEQFSISRMTVLLTYERLIAEGYLETRPAAGTFVAQPPNQPPTPEIANSSALSLVHPPADTSPFAPSGGASMRHGRIGLANLGPDVRVGTSDPSLFPARRWRTLMRSGLDRMGTQPASDDPAGSPALRDAIANWMSTSRGLAVSPDQVMLVKGRQQALHIVAHLASHRCEGRRATGRGSGQPLETHADDQPAHPGVGQDNAMPGGQVRIIMEDPCDAHAAAALTGGGGVLTRVPVDADGLCADRLPDGDAALIHVTPEHQRPLGAVLSGARRIALLDWAGRAGALILEEDIDGELRYGNIDVPPLIGLDRSERVILLGGFAVSLGPWLDTAYLVLPRWLAPFARAVQRVIDDSRNGLEQTALAEFLGGGGYARHLHRLSKTYAARRDALLAAMRRHLSGAAAVWGQQAGLHLAWFPPPGGLSSGAIAALARRHGLDAAAAGDNVVLLGFGAQDTHHLAAGVRCLSEAITGDAEEVPAAAAMPIGFAGAISRDLRP